MKLLLIISLLAGCDRLFGLEYVPEPDARMRSGDGGTDGSKIDASGIDASTIDADPNDLLDFAGYTLGFVCVGTTYASPLKLTRDPLGTITVTATSADPSYVTVTPQTLTFDSSNWNVPQQVNAYGAQATPTSITITITSSPYLPKMDALYVHLAGGICPL